MNAKGNITLQGVVSIFLAVFVAFLPQIASAAVKSPATAKSPSSAQLCSTIISETKTTIRPDGVDNYNIDFRSRAFEGTIRTDAGEVMSGVELSSDYRQATLSLGVNGVVRYIIIDVATMTMADLTPLRQFYQQQLAVNSTAAIVVDEFRCRLHEQLGNDPSATFREIKKTLKHEYGLEVNNSDNYLQVAATLFESFQSISLAPQQRDFLMIAAAAVFGPMLAYIAINCGGCSYGCDCLCC